MCERGCASGDAGTNRDVLAGTVLTRCLQCSAQGFAGASGCMASGDLLAGVWRAGMFF